MKEELSSIMLTKDSPLAYVEKLAKECEKCGHCCRYDSGIFLEKDIMRISEKLSIPMDEIKARFLEEKQLYNKRVWKGKLLRGDKPFGSCVFLRDDHCSIHEFKPFHCRIASGCGEWGTQINIWFMLNYIVEPTDPQAIREWAAYLETHPTIPGGELHELVAADELDKIMNHERLR